MALLLTDSATRRRAAKPTRSPPGQESRRGIAPEHVVLAQLRPLGAGHHEQQLFAQPLGRLARVSPGDQRRAILDEVALDLVELQGRALGKEVERPTKSVK